MKIEDIIKLLAAATAAAAVVQGYNTEQTSQRDDILEKVIIQYATEELRLEAELEECKGE